MDSTFYTVASNQEYLEMDRKNISLPELLSSQIKEFFLNILSKYREDQVFQDSNNIILLLKSWGFQIISLWSDAVQQHQQLVQRLRSQHDGEQAQQYQERGAISEEHSNVQDIELISKQVNRNKSFRKEIENISEESKELKFARESRQPRTQTQKERNISRKERVNEALRKSKEWMQANKQRKKEDNINQEKRFKRDQVSAKRQRSQSRQHYEELYKKIQEYEKQEDEKLKKERLSREKQRELEKERLSRKKEEKMKSESSNKQRELEKKRLSRESEDNNFKLFQSCKKLKKINQDIKLREKIEDIVTEKLKLSGVKVKKMERTKRQRQYHD